MSVEDEEITSPVAPREKVPLPILRWVALFAVCATVIIVLLLAVLPTLGRHRGPPREFRRMMWLRAVAGSLANFEQNCGKLPNLTHWSDELKASGYCEPGHIDQYISESGELQIVVVPAVPLPHIRSSWACLYEDPRFLNDRDRICIAFPSGETIAVEREALQSTLQEISMRFPFALPGSDSASNDR